MKFTIFTCLFLFLNFTNAFAKNIELEHTETVCSKVNGVAVGDDLVIARTLSVPLSSFYFIGARWDYGQWGFKSCNFIFDTNKGPYSCAPFRILSGDNGKTAFGWIAGIGKNPNCWQ